MKRILFLAICTTSLIALLTGCGTTVPSKNSENIVEINSATEERINNFVGIGPMMAARMIKERAARPFDGCLDFTQRVKGLGPMAAAKLSERGLRVNGEICR